MRMYALHTYKPDKYQTCIFICQKLTRFVLHTKNIYARNLEFQNVASLCEAQLQLLMNDEDLEVHRHVASSFHYLREEHLGILSGYIRAFTASASANASGPAATALSAAVGGDARQGGGLAR